MKSKDRILFDVVIRQDTKDSFLSLSDLNHILQRNSNVEQILSENDKTTLKTTLQQEFLSICKYKYISRKQPPFKPIM